MIKNMYRCARKVLLCLSGVNGTEFSRQIFEKYSSVVMKLRLVGTRLLNVEGLRDGQRDRHDVVK